MDNGLVLIPHSFDNILNEVLYVARYKFGQHFFPVLVAEYGILNFPDLCIGTPEYLIWSGVESVLVVFPIEG